MAFVQVGSRAHRAYILCAEAPSRSLLKKSQCKHLNSACGGGCEIGYLCSQPVLRRHGAHQFTVTNFERGLCCSRNINEVIAFGTSGFSAKLGGVIDPSDCSEPIPGSDITRIGGHMHHPIRQQLGLQTGESVTVTCSAWHNLI